MKKSPLAILALTLFIDLLGFGLILPLLPVYILHYGGKPWVGGALLATFSLAQFIFSPIWGGLSDRIGRRPLILMSLFGSAISFIAFGFAPNLIFLFVARVAAGILSSASLPTAQAYIADVTTPEKRASGMAVLGASFGLGFAFGPAIGGVVAQHPAFGVSSLAMPSLVAAGLCLINFVWAFLMLPESLDPEHRNQSPVERTGAFGSLTSIGKYLQDPQVGKQLTVFTFVNFAFTAVEASFSWLVLLRFHNVLQNNTNSDWLAAHPGAVLTPEIAKDLLEKAQAHTTSMIFVIVGITLLITQLAVMRGLSQKIGENRLVVFGTACLVVALLGIAFAPTLPLLFSFAPLIALGNGVLNPSLNALITQSASPQERGQLSGVQQGMGSLARIIAPPINNTLVSVNTAIPFLISSVLMTIAFVLSLRLKPLAPGKTGGAPGKKRDRKH